MVKSAFIVVQQAQAIAVEVRTNYMKNKRLKMLDFIGDIHGHADKLIKLLELLGYQLQGGVYGHPKGRKAFFLGDIIDGGHQVKDVLDIVIPMVQNHSAEIIMGNHEINFLGLHTKDLDRETYLRPRTQKNLDQSKETLNQLNDSQIKRLYDFLWDVPLWFADEKFQAVHACWDERYITFLSNKLMNAKLDFHSLKKMFTKDSDYHNAMEIILKGSEIALPEELHFKDKYGAKRDNARVCWWDEKRKIVMPENDESKELISKYKTMLPSTTLEVHLPTFFGHYWETGIPKISNRKALCLDYSVARGHYLCAYRFNGETELNNENLAYI